MKNNIIPIFLFSLFLEFSSYISFSQEKSNMQPEPIIEINDSSKVCDGYMLFMLPNKCSFVDRNGKALFNIPGNLVAFFNNREEIASHSDSNLVVFNKNLDVLWKVNTYIHHEITITPEEKILLLSKECDTINHTAVRFDNILCFDFTGKELYKWSTYEQRRYLLNFIIKDTNIFHFKTNGSSDPDSVLFHIASKLKRKTRKAIDSIELFHCNAIRVIPENESEKTDTVFNKGNLLICFGNENDSIASFLAIVDPVHYKILWHYVQKDRKMMHTPSLLPNGHILVYVNTAYNRRDSSFIDEIDPITKKVVWSYTEKFPRARSRTGTGSCQRLANGNTLISNASGYVYEVTYDKKIVWQWFANEPIGTIPSSPVAPYRAYLYSKNELKWLLYEK